MKKIGGWIINVANSDNFNEKQDLLSTLLPSLATYWDNPLQENHSHLPSTFLINTILKIKGADKLHEKQKGNLDSKESFNYGESLGNFFYIKKQKKI